MSDRNFRIVSGMVALTLACGAIFFGIKFATGALNSKYQLTASFTAAGQGMQPGSDVKMHGVNIGKVKKVRLVAGRAVVRMDVKAEEKVPVKAKAIIRPKTLFGEKFIDIDPGTAETTGPFLKDEAAITDTLGGFELERVLADAYPILKAIKPEDLLVVLDTLAQAGRGEGPAVNRQIVNFRTLADLQAAHNADTAQFLTDLANLSDELDKRASDIIAGAQSLNEALPVLNARGDELSTTLRQASRLSSDLSDVLENNRPFLEKSITENSKTLQNLYDRRNEIGPLILGLREYFEVQAEAVRIPFGDGTMLAAIKLVFGEDCPQGRDLDHGGCLGAAAAAQSTGSSAGAAPSAKAGAPAAIPPVTLPAPPSLPIGQVVQGSQAVSQLLGGLLR
ncbi:MAG: phospholipid/cholesterol/gamma-HCH transport system substrate-binding protein [Acidimicrobiaceae bacterium]|nr:phospholipid/cholesterol/gamma-HCH transport system substrate-binding protein [Acidimicrobiaceae bacterium]